VNSKDYPSPADTLVIRSSRYTAWPSALGKGEVRNYSDKDSYCVKMGQ
jgi:hypothetical protein